MFAQDKQWLSPGKNDRIGITPITVVYYFISYTSNITAIPIHLPRILWSHIFIYHLFPKHCYINNNKGIMYESFIDSKHSIYIQNKQLAVIFHPSQIVQYCLLNERDPANIPTLPVIDTFMPQCILHLLSHHQWRNTLGPWGNTNWNVDPDFFKGYAMSKNPE